MIETYAIKSEKLRSLMEKSKRFALLSAENKEKIVKKIISMPINEQEEKYIPFFEEKNVEEGNKANNREEAFRLLLEKVQEMDRSVKTMRYKDRESIEQGKEQEEEQRILEELKNI